MTLLSVAFFPINWQKLPQFLSKALGKIKIITIGLYESCLFSVKNLKRLSLSAFMVILNIISFIHFTLALGKSAQLIMH